MGGRRRTLPVGQVTTYICPLLPLFSHPLAKSMDYMQEDLENMSKEYRFWVTERRVAQDRLGDEQVRT